MLLDIRPRVGQVPATFVSECSAVCKGQEWILHFTGFGTDVSKCIEDMRELLRGQILRIIVAAVDCLYQFGQYALFLCVRALGMVIGRGSCTVKANMTSQT